MRAGVLIARLQVDRGGPHEAPARQAVVVHDGPDAASVAHLEVRHPDAAVPLASAACRAAVDAGARSISAGPDLRGLLALGFHEEAGRLVVRHDGLRTPVGL